jgi:c-di-GMP-related signal transduction protein
MLLQISMADALESMQLPEHAAQALQNRDGPWAVYLSLVEALEKPDMAAAQMLAEPLGGLDAMMSMSANAWKAT